VNQSTKIIENGFVFTGDKQNQSGRLALLIQNGRIVDMSKPAHVMKSLHPSAEVIDATHKVILPGFVDAHHTGVTFILRYIASGQPMSRWGKNSSIARALDYLHKDATYEDFLKLYRLSYCVALKSGITTIAEYGFDTPEHSFFASLEAMRQSNVEGVIGLHNGDQIEAAQKQREQSLRFACVIPDEENLTTYNFQSTLRKARELQWPVILHLGETRRGYDLVRKNFNKSITQLYADYHVLDLPVHLIHLSHFEPGDTEIIARSGVPLILSPSAILRKGTGIPPVGELIKSKIMLALGSDWGMSQPLENIQFYTSLLEMLDVSSDMASDLLAVHTKNGARALGLEKQIGTIEIGKNADLAFLDFSEFQLNAALIDNNAERLLHLVLQESTSKMVSDVMIHGEFYVREGNLLIYSEDDLANESREILQKILQVTSPKDYSRPSSAAILQLSSKSKKENPSDELPFEEGFKIVRKDVIPLPVQKKTETHLDTNQKSSQRIQKVFGDDEV
jgi:5-methylthioadenosine/S-adenosylhomocysteine deaminase